MRRSREEATLTRRTIVSAASRLFRERGIAATSVADVMASVGMTVGGFYRHFESKDALVAEAIDLASKESAAAQAAESTRVLQRYLSDAHCKNRGRGCPVAALCSEIAHEPPATREAFTEALRRLIDAVGGTLPEGSRRRRDVLHAASSAVGALVLARATSDEKLARDLLAATHEKLLATTRGEH
jgi:TetR/AcrR family transcriptional repressor of nem operon